MTTKCGCVTLLRCGSLPDLSSISLCTLKSSGEHFLVFVNQLEIDTRGWFISKTAGTCLWESVVLQISIWTILHGGSYATFYAASITNKLLNSKTLKTFLICCFLSFIYELISVINHQLIVNTTSALPCRRVILKMPRATLFGCLEEAIFFWIAEANILLLICTLVL